MLDISEGEEAMKRTIIFDATQERAEVLYQVCSGTGASMTEMLRRLMDYGLKEQPLNQMFPHCSGKLIIGGTDGR